MRLKKPFWKPGLSGGTRLALLQISICYTVALLLPPGFASNVRPPQLPTVGPAKGWLVLHGGGISRDREHPHMKRFVELAGGPKASIVVILTPSSDQFTPKISALYKQGWQTDYSVSDVTLIDARNKTEADSENFVAPLLKATGVWILGGHLTQFADIFLGTRAEREIKAVVERGGVIGGASAGAMIMGSFMILWDSPANETEGKKGLRLDRSHAAGFGVLQHTIVHPHFFARHAEWEMFKVIESFPDLLGIGIDENTAIALHGDQFEVIEGGRVGVFDSKSAAKKKFVNLTKGQKFDLKEFSVIK